MSRLHEKYEPFPWQRTSHTEEMLKVLGPKADEVLTLLFKREPDFGIVRCNGCGRWQDFPPPHTFDAMRQAAKLAGWHRDGQDDLCPICTGN